MDLLTINAAAKILQVTPRRVLALIEDGRLPRRWFGRQMYLHPEDLDPVRVRPGGRPKKKSTPP